MPASPSLVAARRRPSRARIGDVNVSWGGFIFGTLGGVLNSTLLALVPVNLVQGGTGPYNLTTAFQSLAGFTGVTFVNTGQQVLFVSVGSSGPQVIVSDIGLTIQGQHIPGVPSTLIPVNTIAAIGPWSAQYNRPDGTSTVELDFSITAGVSVALINMPFTS